MEETTSSAELYAFYAYNIALSGIGQFGLIIAIPLILEGLANNEGHLVGTDIPCYNLPGLIANGTYHDPGPDCIVQLGGFSFSTIAYTNYLISFSVFLQALVYISVASFGDYGTNRKNFLILFGVLGSVSTMLIPAAYNSSLFWLAGVIVIFINIFHGASYVFLDGYFPILVRNDPLVRPDVVNEEKEKLTFDTRANQVQAYGSILGFATAIVIEISALTTIAMVDRSIMTWQLMVAFTGLWWIAFGTYTLVNLKPRPGPPLPPGTKNYIIFSWKTVFGTFAHFRKIPNTFLYLASFFMYSDGMHTLAQVSILFCKKELGLDELHIMIVAIVFPISAFIGNFFLLFFQRFFKISTKSMLLGCLSIVTLVPLYAGLGTFNNVIGLVHQWEAYMISVWFAFFFGAIQAFGKVLFAELIPVGYESEFFALSSISDRGSSWIGPLIVGAIQNATQDIRYGLFSTGILFIIALPLIYFIDVEKGKKDAAAYLQKDHDTETEAFIKPTFKPLIKEEEFIISKPFPAQL